MNVVEGYVINPGWSALLVDMGIAPGDVLRRAGMPGDLLARGPTMVPAADYFRLWRAVEEVADDPALPIRVARALSPEVFDPPVFAALCSENLNVAARRIARHKRLICPLRLLLSESATATAIEYVWPEHSSPPSMLVLSELAFWVALVRIGTRREVRPLRVTSPHLPDPAAAEAFREYLGVDVTARSAQSIAFSAEDAERPFLTSNAAMWEFFEPGLRERLSALDTDATVTDRVRSTLLELLPAGQSGIRAAAAELAVSARTLQRRLKSEATTFQAVLNDTREDLARHYLTTSSLPTAEIAFLLGYEDTTSFYRAFKAWTGRTPERVRLAGDRGVAGAQRATVNTTR